MKLTTLARMKTDRPVITLAHEQWIRDGAVYSQEAIDFFLSETNKPQRDRTGHLSASSLGSCGRQQQFTWIGMPKADETAQRMSVLLNGQFVHLRLQMAGISAGYIAEAEANIPENKWGIKGTMDGIHIDGSVIEYKSQNSFGFSRIMKDNKPKEEHRFQVGAYLLTTGREKAYIVYENKDNQEIREFTVRMTEDLALEVESRIKKLSMLSNMKELIEPLDSCMEKKGWEYNYCGYKNECLKIIDWKEAERVKKKMEKINAQR